MPRTKVEENLFPVNLKVEKIMLEKLEFEWRQNQYRTRSAYLIDALETFMEGIKCPVCGAMNPKGGHICSVCLRPLPEETNVKVDITVNGKKIDYKPIDEKKEAAKKGW